MCVDENLLEASHDLLSVQLVVVVNVLVDTTPRSFNFIDILQLYQMIYYGIGLLPQLSETITKILRHQNVQQRCVDR